MIFQCKNHLCFFNIRAEMEHIQEKSVIGGSEYLVQDFLPKILKHVM